MDFFRRQMLGKKQTREAKRKLRRTSRRLRRLGSEKLSFVEFSARRNVLKLDVSQFSDADVESAKEEISRHRDNLRRMSKFQLTVFVAIAFFYFDLSPEFQFSLLKVTFSDLVVSTLLFIFAFLNIVSFMEDLDMSQKRALLREVLAERVSLNPSGFLVFQLDGFENLWLSISRAVKSGETEIGAVPLSMLLLSFPIVAILLSALALYNGIVLLACWAIGVQNDWGWVQICLFGAVLIGFFSSQILSPLLNNLRIKFVAPSFEKEFWSNLETHGEVVAFCVLEERVAERR